MERGRDAGAVPRVEAMITGGETSDEFGWEAYGSDMRLR
jgi:hypothetical protein